MLAPVIDWDRDSAEYAAVLNEFVEEARENVEQIGDDLLALEKDPDNGQRLASVLRAFHNIKGNCGWLGLAKLEALGHAAESLLAGFRDGGAGPVPSTAIDALLAAADGASSAIDAIAETGSEGDADFSELMGRLRPDRGGAIATSPDASPSEAVEPLDVSIAAEGTVRVDVKLLDALMNQVGELVLVRNQLVSRGEALGDPALLVDSQHLSQITFELQQGITKTRMQPVHKLFSKLPRMIRDLSQALDKQVRLELQGGETELDRSLIESISDPLIHLVRNAIDHGIEPPVARRAAGKPQEACLKLRAYHQAGYVHIELSDDGAGIAAETVRRRIVELELATGEQAAAMGERELLRAVFLPGFSTAAEVTSVSGRGVGMDVVRSNMERIGGSVELLSAPGKGTTVMLRVPLTLAIIPALVVEADGARYAIPQANIREVVYLDPASGGVDIESVYGAPVFRLRGHLLPLVDLNGVLSGRPSAAIEYFTTTTARYIVVLDGWDGGFGLLVDAMHDIEEIVVKPLHTQLRSLTCYAGATIMGDGSVALILDVAGIAQTISLSPGEDEHSPVGQAAQGSVASVEAGSTLLVTAGGARLGIPLSEVTRLECFPLPEIERAGPRQMVQYGDSVLPLVHLGELLQERRSAPRQPEPIDAVDAVDALETLEAQVVSVVVYRSGRETVGLVVDAIHDIVDQDVEIKRGSTRAGVMGTTVIAGRIAELLDVSVLLDAKGSLSLRPAGGEA